MVTMITSFTGYGDEDSWFVGVYSFTEKDLDYFRGIVAAWNNIKETHPTIQYLEFENSWAMLVDLDKVEDETWYPLLESVYNEEKQIDYVNTSMVELPRVKHRTSYCHLVFGGQFWWHYESDDCAGWIESNSFSLADLENALRDAS